MSFGLLVIKGFFLLVCLVLRESLSLDWRFHQERAHTDCENHSSIQENTFISRTTAFEGGVSILPSFWSLKSGSF